MLPYTEYEGILYKPQDGHGLAGESGDLSGGDWGGWRRGVYTRLEGVYPVWKSRSRYHRGQENADGQFATRRQAKIVWRDFSREPPLPIPPCGVEPLTP